MYSSEMGGTGGKSATGRDKKFEVPKTSNLEP